MIGLLKRARSRLFCRLTRGRVMRTPLCDIPRYLARIHNIRVPQSTDPNPKKSPEGPVNINIVFRLIDSVLEVEGSLAECGVYQGATLASIGLYLREKGSNKEVFGFDSFEGFDDKIKRDLELGGSDLEQKSVGGFSNTSLTDVQHKVDLFDLRATVTLVPGYFENTLLTCEENKFCFVSLDCDMYDSYKQCLQFFYPRLSRGAVVLLDEYNDPAWPGCNKALDEFLHDKPEELEEIESDNFIKYFFRKHTTS